MQLSPIGHTPASTAPRFDPEGVLEAARDLRASVHVVQEASSVGGRVGVARGALHDALQPALEHCVTLGPVPPEWLGDRSFLDAHGVRFPYVAGAMANGIATAKLVIVMAQARMLAFFGAAGLLPDRIAAALDQIDAALGHTDASWGVNLIHSPNEPALEEAVCALYLARGVRRVSASAYVDLTPAVVRFAASGLRKSVV